MKIQFVAKSRARGDDACGPKMPSWSDVYTSKNEV